MTDRAQLAAALGRLDPRHREVLDYSLRRRVPDEDLGELFSGSPSDVARLRAAAVERLSQDLGLERGAELGTMLRELLDPQTWEMVPSSDPHPAPAEAIPAQPPEATPAQPPEATPAQPSGPVGASPRPGPIGAVPSSPTAHRPVGADGGSEPRPRDPAAHQPGAAEPGAGEPAAGEPAPAEPGAQGPGADEPAAAAPIVESGSESETPAESESGTGAKPESEPEAKPDLPDARGSGVRPDRAPVLDMLASSSTPGGDRESRRRGSRRAAMALAVAIAVLAPAGVVAALSVDNGPGDGDGDGDGAGGESGASGTRPFEPQPEAVGEPFPSDPESAFQYPVARVSGTTPLYDRPDGKVKVRIAPRTQWRSPRVLGIVEQRGDWLAVLAPELRNGEVGWISEDQVDRLDAVTWSIRADLSERSVVVRRGSEVVRRFRVGVGRAGHSTPTGRFAVTDKLRVSDEGSPYGCCVVALTGHQTRLPQGWPGGDRLAIHATSDESGIGRAVSLGCMRAEPSTARWLMEAVPLGTPVFVER